MVPAQQGFESDDPAGRQIDDGLVLDPELLALQREGEIVLNANSKIVACSHLSVVDHRLGSSSHFGVIHRRVGIA